MEWMPSDQAYIVTCAGKLFEELGMYVPSNGLFWTFILFLFSVCDIYYLIHSLTLG